tara:strand:+ start:639 stop:1052 length:414 start_codon:yes stop_codon:yes gene_type:complete
MTTETCETRIDAQRDSFLDDARVLVKAATCSTTTAWTQPDLDALDALGVDLHNAQESAQERAQEYPAGVSKQTVYKVEISGGGPASWLEVWINDADITAIVYHFSDWYDHAERNLTGQELDDAESFVRSACYIAELD